MSIQINSEIINEVFRRVKPRFQEKLGKYTHHRLSGEWHFHGLAFVKDELTYVFGFNVGFFNKNNSEHFDTVGMNVLVRTNEPNEELREKFVNFFRENLKYWYFNEAEYESFRGNGREFMRYKELKDFEHTDQICTFIEEGIDALNKIYPQIIEDREQIFTDVLRASFPWHDSIKDVCEKVLSMQADN